MVNIPKMEAEVVGLPAARVRDDVFWTELEIRRVGNLVAECIHARRYVGDSGPARVERVRMRAYVDAMRRKALRVLIRAESFERSGVAAWPGLDPSITDAVSLAEEYVRVVQSYEAVLQDEERKWGAGERNGALDAEDMIVAEDEERDWEERDDVAYREAVAREAELRKAAESERGELLDGAKDGLRRRKADDGKAHASTSYSKEDEQLMARHQPIQDELTANLVDLVGQLKNSVTANNEKILKDNKVIDETEDAVDKNIAGIGRQGVNLAKYARSASISWWLLIAGLVVVLLVFVFVFALMSVPI